MIARALRGECAFSARVSALALSMAAVAVGCGESSPNVDGTAGSPPNAGGGGSGGSAPSQSTAGANPQGGQGTASAGGAAPTSGAPGETIGDITKLFGPNTVLEPAVQVDTPEALKTYWSDRARDRHAREARFHAYEHYLHLYWEKRTAAVEIIDTVGKEPNGSVTFNVKAQWKLDSGQAELRFFFRGIGTVAEYHDNRPMTMVGDVDDFTYTRTVTTKQPEGRPLQVGDKMEFELSQFLDKNYKADEFTGRDNYYGTTMLNGVGKGRVPWAQTGEECENQKDEAICRDSEPIPESAWLGGHTTQHELVSGEPESVFMQMAGNLSSINGQRFVRGRRSIHTNFDDGHHDESAENPKWTEQAGKLGPLFINHSCNQCHFQNSRAVPPEVGKSLSQYVFRVGTATGAEDPLLGHVLQPSDGNGEPSVSIASWKEENGLRVPVFAFSGANAPTHYSPRISPQLVGMGLLEAIDEEDILKNVDEDDANGDGVSGRARRVKDPVDPSLWRLGRFGWKAGQASVRYQVAAALRTDMGVLTSVFPTPDCGSGQQNCGPALPEYSDTDLDDLTAYISLLSVRAQRDWAKADVLRGKDVFMAIGCATCHTPEFKTSAFALHAELRDQTIRPYTDLLLHDMGEGLADTLPEGTEEQGNASSYEWRTPPLWGIGYTKATAGEEAYLHDGRARALTEAILWHGGEGEGSKQKFQALSEAEKNALLTFLKSL